MSTSDRAFNQVKAILNKLDRSIDAAREKRLHTGVPQAPVPAPVRPPAAPVNGQPANGSAYGRATPIPRSQASSLERWSN